jgi:hypothetical protein
MWAPQHAPHVGGPTVTPASRNISTNPSLTAFLYIEIAAGNTSVRIFTFLPLRIFAAAKRSSYFAPVQEPMYDLSNSVEDNSRATVIFSGENGFATVGSSSDASYSKTLANSASESPRKTEALLEPLSFRY